MTLDQLLKTGKLILLRENQGLICGAVVTLDPESVVTLQQIALQLDDFVQCQEFVGQTAEQAIEAAAEFAGVPY